MITFSLNYDLIIINWKNEINWVFMNIKNENVWSAFYILILYDSSHHRLIYLYSYKENIAYIVEPTCQSNTK